MATIVLQTVGSVVGGMIGGPVGAMAGRALGALAGAAIDNALLGGDATRHVEGPRLKDIDGLTSTEGAPIPRVYGRARIGGQLIWATRLEEAVNTDVDRSEPGRQGHGRRAEDRHHHLFLFRQSRGRPVRGPHRLHPPRLGRWARARSQHHRHARACGQRDARCRSADRGEGGRAICAGLSRARLCGVRAPASRRFRQPRAAILLRGDPSRRRAQPHGARRLPHSGRERVRLRHETGDAGARSRQDETREPPSMAARERCDGLPRCAAGPVPQPQARIARGELVRRRPARRFMPRRAAGGRDDQEYRRRHLVRGGRGAGGREGGVPRRRLSRLWRHALRRIRQTPDQGSEGARSRRRALSLRDDGCARRQLPAGSLRRNRPAALSLARAHHLRSRAGQGRLARRHQLQRQRRSNAGSRGLRASTAWFCIMRILRRRREASGASSWAASSSASRACARHRASIRRSRGCGPWRRRCVRSCARPRRSSMPPTGRNTARMFSTAAARCAFPSIRSSPTTTSMRSGSIIIRRSPTGATRPNHADLAAARSVNDVDYLRGRLGSGEAFDWYYATSSERNAQTRRPITDGAYGKPWVFRQKDLVSWWSNRHMERVDGVEIGATAWQPQSKPIWLTEIGIPAVDKGPNGPNVFPDPKSSESAYPPFSRGVRDDLVQARGLEAILSRFDPAQRGFAAEYNPASTSYNGRMVDPDNIFVWAWDARPFPAFPDFDIVWSDSANWETGHWITGRIEGATLDRLIVRILRDFGFADPGPIPVDGFVDGYVIDRPMSVRGALEPLLRLFGVDAVARGGAIAWQGRGGRAVAAPDEGRSRARRQGAVAQAHPRAGDRAAAAGGGRLHRRRYGLPSRRGGLAPPVRREPAGGEGGQRRRHPPRRGAAPRRYLAAGSVGRARRRRVRAVAPAHRARAGRRDRRADRCGREAASHRAHRRRGDAQAQHARGGARRVRAAGLLHPASGEASAAGARQAAGGRARSAAGASAIPPPCNMWRSRRIPGRVP